MSSKTIYDITNAKHNSKIYMLILYHYYFVSVFFTNGQNKHDTLLSSS